MASPDLSVFQRIKTKQDFDREAEDFAYNKALKQAEIKKAGQLDVDKLGEQAFMKAAMGAPLTPQELAAAQYVDAKSGGTSFNPVTGEQINKQRISERINLPSGSFGGGRNEPPASPMAGGNPYAKGGNPAINQDYGDIKPLILDGSGDLSSTDSAPPPQKNQWDIEFENQFNAAEGNPKLQQSLREAYAKSKIEMNGEQSKNAGFADRIASSNPIINEPDIQKAGLNTWEKFKSNIPLVNNYITSDEFQSYDQAKRDIINAILRRESGAVIADSEFLNADRQYFPQPGDSETVLQQKAKNRESALSGIAKSAGPAYSPPQIKLPDKSKDKASQAESIFNAKKAIRNGANPDMVRQRLIDNGIDPTQAGL